MYLKEYNLSRVSEDICMKMIELIHNKKLELRVNSDVDFSFIEIFPLDEEDDQSVFPYPVLLIRDDGDIETYQQFEPIGIDLPNQQKINHLLLETQWIDTRVELPKNDCNVYVKTEYGIQLCKYRKSQRYFKFIGLSGLLSVVDDLCNFDQIIGWLPADKVVL